MKILIILVVAAVFVTIMSSIQWFYSIQRKAMNVSIEAEQFSNFGRSKFGDSLEGKDISNDSMMNTIFPKEVNLLETTPDTLSNKEKIIVPIGEPPQGKEAIENLKCKELEVIPEDSSIKKVEPVTK